MAGHAIRFLGDFTSDAGFLALVGGTTVNGLGARFDFDGTFTNIRAVPEPSSLVAFGLGALGLGLLARRGHARSNR